MQKTKRITVSDSPFKNDPLGVKFKYDGLMNKIRTWVLILSPMRMRKLLAYMHPRNVQA